MAGETVVFVTGAGRGIGRAVVEKYLARPNHIVIGSVRDASSSKYDDLKAHPTADGTRLLLVSIESTSLEDQKNAVEEIEAAGIDHLDVVIANAGIASTPTSLESSSVQAMLDCFQVNGVGSFLLYEAVKPLLDRSSRPVWAPVSSLAGSIAEGPPIGAASVTPYGMSKAALNFLTAAVHASNPEWIAFSIHPGMAQSDMGNKGAKFFGWEKAPITLEECSTKIVEHIDNATRENTSGKFIDVIKGQEVAW